MLLKLLPLALTLISISSAGLASSPDWTSLRKLDTDAPVWTPEVSHPKDTVEITKSLEQDMAPYYLEFQSKGVVSIFLGWGYEIYSLPRYHTFYSTLQAASEQLHLGLTQWTSAAELPKIGFTDPKNNVRYEITLGHERSDYINAFSHYDVVMYGGHSRHGRGPAFDSFSNYFRMGNVFDQIEIEAENTNFLTEEIQLTSKYPIKSIQIRSIQPKCRSRIADRSRSSILQGSCKV